MVLSKVLRFGEGRMVKRLDGLASYVESLNDEYEALSDEKLQAKTEIFKKRLEKGETLDEILPEAFATAREAAWRVLGQKPYHVQIMGAGALHQGDIAENIIDNAQVVLEADHGEGKRKGGKLSGVQRIKATAAHAVAEIKSRVAGGSKARAGSNGRKHR